LHKTSLSRIARVLAVVWPLIWTANVYAVNCKNFFGGMHEALEHDVVSEHGVGHDDGDEGHRGAHEHGKDASDDKGADTCCCVTLTAASAAVGHNASPPSESRSNVQPDPALRVGVLLPLPALQLACADSRPPPRSRTPLYLLHLRLLN
jgi:hypothetical protein